VDRLERLVNLVAALLDSRRPLTRAELRVRVGGYADDDVAFRRNFERDKETLRQIGLPLLAETRDGEAGEEQVAYRIDREAYELPDPGLTAEELTALRLAAGALRSGGPWAPGVPRDALRKLAASAPVGSDDRAPDERASDDRASAPRPTPGQAADPEDQRGGAPRAALTDLGGGPDVAVAFGAIAERRRVSFTYRGETRLVDPWRLSYRSGRWYLAGLDHARGEAGQERLYRLDRVEAGITTTGEPGAFERPVGRAAVPIPPWRLGDGPEDEVRVLVDAAQAPEAIASVGEEAVLARHPDGAVEVELRVTSRDGLRSWVLGFLDHAELLDPPELRSELCRWLESIAGPGRGATPTGSAGTGTAR
jgi:proteasome accessory factor B